MKSHRYERDEGGGISMLGADVPKTLLDLVVDAASTVEDLIAAVVTGNEADIVKRRREYKDALFVVRRAARRAGKYGVCGDIRCHCGQ